MTLLFAAGVERNSYCGSVHSPDTNAKEALREIYEAVSGVQSHHTKGIFHNCWKLRPCKF